MSRWGRAEGGGGSGGRGRGGASDVGVETAKNTLAAATPLPLPPARGHQTIALACDGGARTVFTPRKRTLTCIVAPPYDSAALPPSNTSLVVTGADR